jgi:hypothetical protein
MNTNKSRVKFFLFIGNIFFFYLILYFPSDSDDISSKQILFDIFRSIIMAFLVTYFAFWGVNFIDKKLLRKE